MHIDFQDALRKLEDADNKLKKQTELQPVWDSTVKGLHQDLRKRNKEVRGWGACSAQNVERRKGLSAINNFSFICNEDYEILIAFIYRFFCFEKKRYGL